MQGAALLLEKMKFKPQMYVNKKSEKTKQKKKRARPRHFCDVFSIESA